MSRKRNAKGVISFLLVIAMLVAGLKPATSPMTVYAGDQEAIVEDGRSAEEIANDDAAEDEPVVYNDEEPVTAEKIEVVEYPYKNEFYFGMGNYNGGWYFFEQGDDYFGGLTLKITYSNGEVVTKRHIGNFKKTADDVYNNLFQDLCTCRILDKDGKVLTSEQYNKPGDYTARVSIDDAYVDLDIKILPLDNMPEVKVDAKEPTPFKGAKYYQGAEEGYARFEVGGGKSVQVSFEKAEECYDTWYVYGLSPHYFGEGEEFPHSDQSIRSDNIIIRNDSEKTRTYYLSFYACCNVNLSVKSVKSIKKMEIAETKAEDRFYEYFTGTGETNPVNTTLKITYDDDTTEIVGYDKIKDGNFGMFQRVCDVSGNIISAPSPFDVSKNDLHGLAAGSYQIKFFTAGDEAVCYSPFTVKSWDAIPEIKKDVSVNVAQTTADSYYSGDIFASAVYYADLEPGEYTIYAGDKEEFAIRIFDAEGNRTNKTSYVGTAEYLSVSEAGRYYLDVRARKDIILNLVSKTSGGGNEVDDSGKIELDGTEVASLAEAFKQMKDSSKDYEIVIGRDVKGEKNLTIPKTAKSVTIKGRGHVVELTGTKLTANAPLTLDDVCFKAVNRKNAPAKFMINAKKGLTVSGVSADSKSFKIKSTVINADGDLTADVITCKELALNEDGSVKIPAGCKLTVSKALKGNGGEFELQAGFNRPLSIKGELSGTVSFTGAEVLKDGTQLLKTSAKKINADMLKSGFDVSAITGNDGNTYLYYLSSGKACIFGEKISYNGNGYGLWKDAVAAMNADIKAKKTTSLTVEISGEVNMAGGFRLPSKGYEKLDIQGNGTLIFTGDIKLTGDLNIGSEVKLKKVDKKGNEQQYKVNSGKYEFTQE